MPLLHHMNAAAPLLEAAPNFRDIGGYASRLGGTVRRGRMYRSELLLELSPRDLDTLRQLDIGLVCDLRSPAERQHLSNQWPQDRAFQTLALDVDGELSAVQPDKWGRRLADPAFDAARAHDALIDNYRRMPSRFAHDLRALLMHLSRRDASPVLVHCAAGKDRTGFVSAMLLWALGVPEETIFEDYMTTAKRYSIERLIHSRARLVFGLDLPDHAHAAMRVLASVQPDFLQAALDAARGEYGSIEHYLEHHCGLTPDLRDALHEALLDR